MKSTFRFKANLGNKLPLTSHVFHLLLSETLMRAEVTALNGWPEKLKGTST